MLHFIYVKEAKSNAYFLAYANFSTSTYLLQINQKTFFFTSLKHIWPQLIITLNKKEFIPYYVSL